MIYLQYLSYLPSRFRGGFLFYISTCFCRWCGDFKKIRALLIRVRLELSSQDSTIYFVVKRPYDIILTLNKGKVKKKHPSLRQVLSVSPFGHKIIPQWQDTLPRLHHYLNIILFVCQHVSKDQITTFLQEPDLFCPSSLYLIEFFLQDPSRLLVLQLLTC